MIIVQTECFLPVFVKVNRMDANGMSSSKVATVPNLYECVSELQLEDASFLSLKNYRKQSNMEYHSPLTAKGEAEVIISMFLQRVTHCC